MCARVLVKVPVFHSGWLFVCLPVFKKQSENKSLQNPQAGFFVCMCVYKYVSPRTIYIDAVVRLEKEH